MPQYFRVKTAIGQSTDRTTIHFKTYNTFSILFDHANKGFSNHRVTT